MATIAAVAGVGAIAVITPAASAVGSLANLGVAGTDDDRSAAVAEARDEAALMERQRLQELADSGLSHEEAAAQVLKEQKHAAQEIRLRIMKLTVQGMTTQEIADATPGLVLVSEVQENLGPLSSNGDLRFFSLSHTFFVQCACDNLDAQWEQEDDLESGKDVVGMHVEESTQMLGGSIHHCDTPLRYRTLTGPMLRRWNRGLGGP